MLNGKAAVITGAGSGIGAAIAKRFAKEGAKVVAIGRNEDHLQQTVTEICQKGGSAKYILGNITKEDQVANFINEALNCFGHLDILVNNAAIGLVHSFLECSLEEWQTTINTNLTSVFLCSQYEVAQNPVASMKGNCSKSSCKIQIDYLFSLSLKHAHFQNLSKTT